MAKKKKKPQKQQPPKMPPVGSMEQVMRDITRMLDEQEFESIEEINQFLEQNVMGRRPAPAAPRSALEEAQELVYKAHEAGTKAKALKLVRQALDISPDCADGYVLLAELNAPSLAEARAFYEAGVRAGERALGDEFEELKGHFWGFIETRPYMRARMGLAVTLWQMGQLEAAAGHMAAMLELNPNDNQGVRDLYITLLLELDDAERMEQLLAQYPEDWTAYRRYGQALYTYRKQGPGEDANTLLAEAIAYNPHVPLYLLGKKRIPRQTTVAYYSPGDENEALDYVVDGIRPWTSTEGALAWLGKIFEARKADE